MKEANAIKEYLKASKKLRELGILKNKHSFTNQVGEWLVETIFEGARATSGIQKAWDIDVNGKKIQVKTHSKDGTNPARFTTISKDIGSEELDELVIIVFSSEYKLQEFYKIPWIKALEKIKPRGKKSPREELNWSEMEEFRVDITELPHQEIVKIFC